jgi:hypothetical protein
MKFFYIFGNVPNNQFVIFFIGGREIDVYGRMDGQPLRN